MIRPLPSLPAWGVLERISRRLGASLSHVQRREAARRAMPDTGQIGGKQAHIALVGVGPGAADLLTLRAMRMIAAADVVLYDRLVEPEVVALSSRNAHKIYVGKEVGAHAWPQDRIDAKIIEEARKGQRVVRLKSGDPSIFGRVTEELIAARAAGIEVEIVPGVTAACAAAAHRQVSLTERGVADTLILTTGTCREGDPLPESALHARPGTTTVFYMSVRQATRIRDGLIMRGVPNGVQIQIAADVAKPSEQHLSCALRDLPECLQEANINGCAILILTWPKEIKMQAKQYDFVGAAL